MSNGIANLYRADVKPFTDRQIGLVQSFAVQAVLAMENARLFNERIRKLPRISKSSSKTRG
jgi:GAF domain-containing protein